MQLTIKDDQIFQLAQLPDFRCSRETWDKILSTGHRQRAKECRLIIERYVTQKVRLWTSVFAYFSSFLSICPSSIQSLSVEGNKVVNTVNLKATPEVMKDGVTCEVANEYGKDTKTFLVSLKRGQCEATLSPSSLYLYNEFISMKLYLDRWKRFCEVFFTLLS